MPALQVEVFGIHTEKVSGKKRCLISARTTTDFQNCILVVLRICRNQHDFDFLLQYRDTFLAGLDFLAEHVLHFRVILHLQHFLSFLDIGEQTQILLPSLHQVLQILVFTSQLYITFLVGNDGRVGNKG